MGSLTCAQPQVRENPIDAFMAETTSNMPPQLLSAPWRQVKVPPGCGAAITLVVLEVGEGPGACRPVGP